jgi:hypothetical protein
MKNDIKENPKSCQASVSGCTGNFLTEAVKSLVYKTPQKVLEYVEKHKNDFLIKNPSYAVCDRITKNN